MSEHHINRPHGGSWLVRAMQSSGYVNTSRQVRPYSSRHLKPLLTKPAVSPAILLWIQHSSASYLEVSDEAILETANGTPKWKLAALGVAMFCIGIAIGKTLPIRSEYGTTIDIGNTQKIQVGEKPQIVDKKMSDFSRSNDPVDNWSASTSIAANSISISLSTQASANRASPMAQETGSLRRQLAHEFRRSVGYSTVSYKHYLDRLLTEAPPAVQKTMSPRRQPVQEFWRSIGHLNGDKHSLPRDSSGPFADTAASDIHEFHTIARLAMIELENRIAKKILGISSAGIRRSAKSGKTTSIKLSKKVVGRCSKHSAVQKSRWGRSNLRCRSWQKSPMDFMKRRTD
jgi:hypothetical protein